ncbi:MAG TPA: SHOCT domain-containing protein [Nocardioidaceae bacterium]|nr:SHOCT domain-containing protein [Nocardioidaceae bacterium]
MELWEAMVSIFWFMLLVAWFWLLISILTDVFRDRHLSGWAKGLWCLFVIVLPWVGVLVYLIARGPSMHERAMDHAKQNERDFRQYVQDVAQPTSVADELAKLADLRDRGAITAGDYEAAKAKLLATSSGATMSAGAHTADASG